MVTLSHNALLAGYLAGVVVEEQRHVRIYGVEVSKTLHSRDQQVVRAGLRNI